MTEKQKKVTYIKGKEEKKAYAKKVKLAEKKRKQKEKKEKKLLKEWRDRTKKHQDSGNKLTRWIRKHDMKKFAEWTGGKLDRGGPTHEKEEQKKIKVIKTKKGKERYEQHMQEKKRDERKKKLEAKAEYYHKTGKQPLWVDLPGIPSKITEKVGKFPSIPGSDKKHQKEMSKKWLKKQKKKAAEYGQPIVKYKTGGTVKKTYAYGGTVRKAKYKD